jgi:prepilin-type N-terminal cleavage/methylation domain-containing protein
MRLLSEENGFSLIELLVGITLALIVFGGVLTLLDTFQSNAKTSQLRNENQDNARSAIDRLSRNLRNVAAPSAGSAGALEKAGPYDMVFQTVSSTQVFGAQNVSNQMRVRYCLDSSNPSSENLWLQTQTWTTSSAPAAPGTSSCPSSSWSSQYKLVSAITNLVDGQNPRSLFTYAPLGANATAQLNGVEVDLFLNPRPGSAPGETELKSAIYLRNSNAPPTSSFTISQVNGHVLLNGSQSADPNGQALTYQWSLDGSSISGATTQQYDAGSLNSGSNHTFALTVTDTDGLTATSQQAVTIQ